MSEERRDHNNPYENLENALFRSYLEHVPTETVEIPQDLADPISSLVVERVIPEDHNILTPIPNPLLENAVSAWLQYRGTSIQDIHSGIALSKAIGVQNPPDGTRRCLNQYIDALRSINIPRSEIPHSEEVRWKRNWPRVLNSLAKYAREKDSANWQRIATDAGDPTLGSRIWQQEMLNEKWKGDHTVRTIINSLNTDSPSATILVAGSQGSGKSATVRTILGRPAIPQSHALTLIKDYDEMEIEERELVRKFHHLKIMYGDSIPIQLNEPMASSKTSRISLKVDNKVLTFVEIPSMERAFQDIYPSGLVVDTVCGNSKKVMDDLQKENIDLALIVERLDDLDVNRFKHTLNLVHKLYGKYLLQRTLIILTHGESFPPAGMSYEVWTFDQIRKVTEILHKFMPDNIDEFVPVIIFENSMHCHVDPNTKRAVLPNGEDFLQTFTTKVDQIKSRTAQLGSFQVRPHRKWWEIYVVMAVLSIIVSRIR